MFEAPVGAVEWLSEGNVFKGVFVETVGEGWVAVDDSFGGTWACVGDFASDRFG